MAAIMMNVSAIAMSRALPSSAKFSAMYSASPANLISYPGCRSMPAMALRALAIASPVVMYRASAPTVTALRRSLRTISVGPSRHCTSANSFRGTSPYSVIIGNSVTLKISLACSGFIRALMSYSYPSCRNFPASMPTR